MSIYYPLNIIKLLKNANHSMLLWRQTATVQALCRLAKENPPVVWEFSTYFKNKVKVSPGHSI